MHLNIFPDLMLKYISVVVRNALAMMTAAPGVASRLLSTVNSGHGQFFLAMFSNPSYVHIGLFFHYFLSL